MTLLIIYIIGVVITAIAAGALQRDDAEVIALLWPGALLLEIVLFLAEGLVFFGAWLAKRRR